MVEAVEQHLGLQPEMVEVVVVVVRGLLRVLESLDKVTMEEMLLPVLLLVLAVVEQARLDKIHFQMLVLLVVMVVPQK
jgi:hypothetical protein